MTRDRCPSAPLISAKNLPYQANAVFNAGAADLGNEVLLLLRIESSSGRSHLIAARSNDGVRNWQVEGEALIHPAQGHSFETNGAEDCRITWMGDLDAWILAYVGYSECGPGVALAKTRDFRTVERLGLVFPPDDKNAALFRESSTACVLCFTVPAWAEGASGSPILPISCFGENRRS